MAAGESIPATPVPASTFPAAISDTVLAQNIIAAIASSGGCSVSASVGSATLAAVYVPGKAVRSSMISDAWVSGTVTASATGTARFVAHRRATLDGASWINDGTPLNGRPWLKLPQPEAGSQPPTALVSAHPLVGILGLVTQTMPDAAGHAVFTSLQRQAQLAGTETVDGQPVAHYTWTTGDSGTTRRQDLWVGRDWLPRKRTFSYLTVPVSAQYTGWGTVPTITPPGDADSATAPTGS